MESKRSTERGKEKKRGRDKGWGGERMIDRGKCRDFFSVTLESHIQKMRDETTQKYEHNFNDTL